MIFSQFWASLCTRVTRV